MELGDISRFETSTEISANMSEAVLKRHIDRLKAYVETGEPYSPYLDSRESYLAFIKLLGVETISGASVLGYQYRNSNDYAEDRHYGALTDGDYKVEELMESIADARADLVEFPNNFTIGLGIAFDEKTAVVLSYEMDEQPGICDSCWADEEYMNFNGEYNCGHGVNDTYSAKYGAVVMNRDDISETTYS